MFKPNILGNLTADPTISDVGCCNFTVAANTSLMVDGKPKTEFVRVAVWGKRGETVARFFKKGDPIFVYGDYVSSEYVGQDGNTHISHNLRNADFDFVRAGTNRSSNASTANEDGDDEEDVPDIFG